MLTGYQCEVVAFIGEGEFICHSCAHAMLDSGDLASSELGVGSLSPVIRYALDESNSERAWEYAKYELELEEGSDEFDKAIDDYPGETCGQCGEVIE